MTIKHEHQIREWQGNQVALHGLKDQFESRLPMLSFDAKSSFCLQDSILDTYQVSMKV